MPILLILVFGFIAWYFWSKIIASKTNDRQVIEARLCVLEHQIQELKNQAAKLQNMGRDTM